MGKDDFFYTEEELKKKGTSHKIHHMHQQDKTKIQTKASFKNPNDLIIEHVSMDLGRSFMPVAVTEEGICMLQEHMIVSSNSEMKDKQEEEDILEDCDDYLADAIVTGDFDIINKIKENSIEKIEKSSGEKKKKKKKKKGGEKKKKKKKKKK